MASKSLSNQRSTRNREWSPLELAEVKTPRRIGAIWQPKGASARRRIKFEDRASCFHVMSRTVNGEMLFGNVEKEAFRRMMWRMASFSGVEVLAYVVMDNHFHILSKVPNREKWLSRFEGEEGERRLLKHLGTVYSKKFLIQLEREIEAFREQGNELAVEELLARFRKRFCDISLFVKELKERFSRWFNKQQGRRGTLWMDRFKSVLVDGQEALATMAAYIDLNPVRAGIVDDPLDYVWSGYGEANAGSRRAKRGICKALNLPQDSWEARVLPRYRIYLFDQGIEVGDERRPSGHRKRGVKPEAGIKIQGEKGVVPVARHLRQRISSFSNGIAVGSENFVRRMAARYQGEMGRQKKREPREFKMGGRFFVLRE